MNIVTSGARGFRVVCVSAKPTTVLPLGNARCMELVASMIDQDNVSRNGFRLIRRSLCQLAKFVAALFQIF